MNPLVSVIVPCYNQSHFLADALASLRAQTYPHWECIIIDDGATDDTASVADALAATDSRVRVVHQSNRGLAGARNRGLGEARGEFVQFLDADDLLAPDKFERQLQVLEGVDGLALSYTDYRYCPADDPTQTVSRDTYPPPRFNSDNPLVELISRWETQFSIPAHCWLFDGDLFRTHGVRFDEKLPTHEDWDCWVQVLSCRPAIKLVEAPLAIYRLHSASMCTDSIRMWRGFELAIDKQRNIHKGDIRVERALCSKLSEMKGVYDLARNRQELHAEVERLCAELVLLKAAIADRDARILKMKSELDWINSRLLFRIHNRLVRLFTALGRK